jgi:hypothetical protein
MKKIYFIFLFIVFISSCVSVKELEKYKWIWINEEIQEYENIKVMAFISNEIWFLNDLLYLREKQGWKTIGGINIVLKSDNTYSMIYKIKRNKIIIGKDLILMKNREGDLVFKNKIFMRQEIEKKIIVKLEDV